MVEGLATLELDPLVDPLSGGVAVDVDDGGDHLVVAGRGEVDERHRLAQRDDPAPRLVVRGVRVVVGVVCPVPYGDEQAGPTEPPGVQLAQQRLVQAPTHGQGRGGVALGVDAQRELEHWLGHVGGRGCVGGHDCASSSGVPT